MTLKYYYDLMSQPSRAVYIFLKANGIAFEAKPIALRKGMSKYGHCSWWHCRYMLKCYLNSELAQGSKSSMFPSSS